MNPAVSTPRARGQLRLRGALLFALGAAVLGVVATPSAVSAGKKPPCQPAPPTALIQNTYGWSAFGTWATPGQRVPFFVQLSNWSCSTATVTATLQAPAGFTVAPTSVSASLGSRQSAMVTVYVTSPADIAVGDYPVSTTASSQTRDGLASGNADTSYYKVYTSDVAAPTGALQSHISGGTVKGTVTLSHSFRDDHMARRVDLSIDGRAVTSAVNPGITYELDARYTWDTRSLSKGQHTVTWKAYDDFNNEFVDSWVLTVQ